MFKAAKPIGDSPLVADEARPQTRPVLRLLEGGRSQSRALDSSSGQLEVRVRTTRRQAARTLRAMQATGEGPSTWPGEVVTRLAHVDCITARYLIEPRKSIAAETSYAVQELAQIERLLFDALGTSARADVRRSLMQVHVDEKELVLPLLVPHQAPTRGDYTLNAGLGGVSEMQLDRIAERLGIRARAAHSGRRTIEVDLHHLLADDQMVGVLVSTLDDNALTLLADLVRGKLNDRTREALAAYDPVQVAVGAEGIHTMVAAAATLRDCGLAFARCPNHGARLWVPVELKHRLDGVLQVFGL